MKKHVSPTVRLRRFGLIVAIGLSIIAGVSWWRGHTVVPPMLWSVAAALTLAGLVVPLVLAPFERAWLAIGAVLAWINTRIILTALFYLVITPVAVAMKPFRDPLSRRLEAVASTYWIRRATRTDGDRYGQQF